jgi:enoyl-CoA hydratase
MEVCEPSFVVPNLTDVTSALDLPLSEGLRLERRLFHSLFATNDQKEGGYPFDVESLPLR